MKIERVTQEDAQELLAIYAPYVTDTAITFELEVPSVQEFANRIRTISAELPYIKAVENGQILGYAYANHFKSRRAYDWSVEVTVYVRKDVRGRGIGSALYNALEKALKGIGILNMNACIAVPRQEDEHLNNASALFHEQIGYVLVGTFHNSGYKFHTWYDMIWMEKMIGSHEKEQAEVRFGQWQI